MTHLVIAKRGRDTVIIGENLPKDKATTLARDAVLSSTVSSAHVIPTEGSFFESTIPRANPDNVELPEDAPAPANQPTPSKVKSATKPAATS